MTPSSTLEGRTILVTGASRGIGRAVVELLVPAGANVVGTFHASERDARDLESALAGTGGELLFVRCDVTSPPDVAAVVSSASTRFGRIDGLVNNAGIWRGGRLVDLAADDWRAVIETDLLSVFDVTQRVLRHMLEDDRGAIVNVSSIVGMQGYPGDTAYGAAKAGLIGFTLSLAKELARTGVVVNAVAPGFLETDMTAALDERARQRVIDHIPAGRQGTPGEAADVITYLLSAPPYLTGAVIPVAGGM